MSAAVLREAAALMRERAEAIEIPWRPYSDPQLSQRSTPAEFMQDMQGYLGGAWGDHAGAWHPAVALAVANWLDGVALLVEAKDDGEYFDLDGDPIAPEDTHAIGSALAVAHAYLGDQP